MNTSVARRQDNQQVDRNAEFKSVHATLEKLRPQMEMALPKHLTVERLMRVALTACQNTPKLLECDRKSLFGAIMTCAQLGLEPDGIMGQAYLVPFAGKVQFIPGYKGLLSLARNSGDVTAISAHEVRAGDHFDFAYGLNERLEHVPGQQRGDVTHFYAYAKFRDGGHHFDVMTLEEVVAVRDKSQGWQSAVKYRKTESSPWSAHFVEMGKKTAIRRIAKYLPLSVQKAAAISAMYDAGIPAQLGDAGELIADQPEAIEHNEGGEQEGPKGSALDKFEERQEKTSAVPEGEIEAAEAEAFAATIIAGCDAAPTKADFEDRRGHAIDALADLPEAVRASALAQISGIAARKWGL